MRIPSNDYQHGDDASLQKAYESAMHNPIKADPELKAMIAQLNDVTNVRAFKQWKSSFLKKYETFLGVEGTQQAQDAYSNFRKSTQRFVKHVRALQQLVEKGDISEERTTVRGRNCILEMIKLLTALTAEERELIPAKSTQEQERGYTKFHLGAVLVRDGFQEYKQMTMCCEIVTRLRDTCLHKIADKQQLIIISKYEEQMKRFRDIMADLGLSESMLKCWEYDDEEEELIFVCLKTGAVGSVGIKNCLDRQFLHAINDGKKLLGFKEALKDQDDQAGVLDLVQEKLFY